MPRCQGVVWDKATKQYRRCGLGSSVSTTDNEWNALHYCSLHNPKMTKERLRSKCRRTHYQDLKRAGLHALSKDRDAMTHTWTKALLELTQELVQLPGVTEKQKTELRLLLRTMRVTLGRQDGE